MSSASKEMPSKAEVKQRNRKKRFMAYLNARLRPPRVNVYSLAFRREQHIGMHPALPPGDIPCQKPILMTSADLHFRAVKPFELIGRLFHRSEPDLGFFGDHSPIMIRFAFPSEQGNGHQGQS